MNTTVANWTNHNFDEVEVQEFVQALQPALHADQNKYLTATVKYQNTSIIVKYDCPYIKVSMGGANDVHVISTNPSADDYTTAIAAAFDTISSLKRGYEAGLWIDKSYAIAVEVKLSGKKYTKQKDA